MGVLAWLSPAALAAETAPSDLAVVLLGIGVVFFGLLCIVGICALFGCIFRAFAEKKPVPASAPGPDPAERGAVLAAVCAVIAEELGTDVSALRVHSFRKIDQ
ncbi:MAG: OadG family protein [Clostridia bacterium]|jgi:Na+-transporting methylmalonyl-CoA/oxaloacetate decarboxylase gamma subunit|nr:OadG family protein [Clostridia bacterium]MBQ4297673.1 OadG family protein [Clostridia bacterium]